ncbi:hypothetical protein [Halomontanus rarus]|uniref:hypothetical protein n=1 Tax=Halomontanus rarus TaxID=3034020 RepID=UPI001A992857
MDFQDEFLDIVCQSKRIWLPFFYIDTILLVLAGVGYVSADPGSGGRIISIFTLVMLLVPFAAMISFLSVCKRRPG